MENDEFLASFIEEAYEMLSDAEDLLIALDQKNDEYEDRYNCVFRIFHSIKGGAGMFGLSSLESHMHTIETLFSNFKNDQNQFTEDVQNYFLRSLDKAIAIIDKNEFEFNHMTFEDLTSNKKKDIVTEEKIIRKSNNEIFLIDDDLSVLESLKDVFLSNGYNVCGFSSPVVALEELKTTKPLVVFSDYKMPGMNGLDFAREVIKRRENVPIVFLSGEMTPDQIKEGLKIGIYTYLKKPVDTSELLITARNAMVQSFVLDAYNNSLKHILYHFVEFSSYLEKENKEYQLGLLKQDVFDMFDKKSEIKRLILGNLDK